MNLAEWIKSKVQPGAVAKADLAITPDMLFGALDQMTDDERLSFAVRLGPAVAVRAVADSVGSVRRDLAATYNKAVEEVDQKIEAATVDLRAYRGTLSSRYNDGVALLDEIEAAYGRGEIVPIPTVADLWI